MKIAIVTPATTYPVTLDEAKAQCRVDGSDDDASLTGLIEAAVEHVEAYCGRSFTAQTLALYLDGFTAEIELPRGPVASVTHVKYLDTDNVLQTLDTAVYQVDLLGGTISLLPGQSWPATSANKNSVIVTYQTDATLVPAPVKHAILLLIALWYDNRASAAAVDMKEIPHAVDALLANHREFSF